jgi:hypothetical protein
MTNSMVGDDWIRLAVASNPVQKLPNGSFLSGPVRLSYPSLFVPKANRLNPAAEPTYEASLIFPPIANVQVLYTEIVPTVAAAYPGSVVNGQVFGVAFPFNDQAVPGPKGPKKGHNFTGLYLNAKNVKPVNVGLMTPAGFQVLTDQTRVYGGVWAICNFTLYASKAGVKRIAVGLNSVVIYGDDEPLGGAQALDPNTAFAGIKAGAPIAIPHTAFGGGGIDPAISALL